MSVLFITLKSNVRRLFSETREQKCFLAGSELQGHVTNFPFPVPLLLYTYGNADMDICTICIISRPDLGVLLGDVWNGNKSERRAREEHVLLPGSLGLLRAAQLSKTRLWKRQVDADQAM